MKEVIKNLMPYIKNHKEKVIASLMLSLVLAGIQSLQVSLVKPIFDHGLSPDANLNEVLKSAGLLLLLGLINFPARFYHFYWIRFVVDRATCDIRQEVFQKLQKLPTSFYGKSKQGTILSGLINDTQVYAMGLRSCIDLIREPLKATAMFVYALKCDWQLTFVIIFTAPLFALIFNQSGKKVRKNQNDVQEDVAELTHTMNETLQGHKISKAFNLQDFVLSRFQKAQDRYFNAIMRTTWIEEFAHPLVEVVGAIAFSGVIVFAHFRIKAGAMTTGDFVSFIAALALLMDPIRKYSQANVKLNQARAAEKRIFEMLNYPEERDLGVFEIEDFKHSIKVKDLSFSYGEQDVVKNLNLEIKKGQKVALVGLSGSGKSTLINLLLGLYPVDRGVIEIDGRSIQDIKLKSLRSIFGLVSQDIFLFHDTITENLKLGKTFTDEQIKNALSVSYADQYINELPLKSDTVVGDRGTRLSGGQQQRLTIARAFLRNPDVLLFDEATSALDNESEKIVQKALEEISGQKTVIAVAHRLSTIAGFDRIYVMKEGRVVEEGTHQELISQNGEYYKLYQLSQN